MIRLSVPAKIHLLGEHAVVYGAPALLTAINLRMSFEIEKASRKTIISEGLGSKSLKALCRVIEYEISKRYPKSKIPAARIRVVTQFPIGYGLGSSAAISVGLTAGILALLGQEWSFEEIYAIAFQGEKFFHGNPSGADVVAVLYGGYTWFRKETEFLKLSAPMSFSIPGNVKEFYFIDSGAARESTKQMVKSVAKNFDSNPKKVQIFLERQEALTRDMARALQAGHKADLIQTIIAGEKNLETLGVVGIIAQKMIRKIERVGGAAKISGAGGVIAGSGMIWAYHTDPGALTVLAKKNAWKILAVQPGAEGLRYE